ncbi:MAG: putative ABC transporter permease [Firmicutes bacterium]|nr:putative ABC transporter permease [Bacillota bacterium]
MNQNLTNLILFFSFYSLLGWIIETLFKSVHAKRFVNSGFLSGPFCPVYGFGALLVIQSWEMVNRTISLVDPATRMVISVILAIMGTSVLEYLTGSYWKSFLTANGGITAKNGLIFKGESVLNILYVGGCWPI